MQIQFQGSASLKASFYFEQDSRIAESLKNKKIFCGKAEESFLKTEAGTFELFLGLGKKPEQGFFPFLKTGTLAAKKILKINEETAEINLTGLSEKETFFTAEGFFLQSLYDYSLKQKKETPALKTVIFKTPFETAVNKALILAQSRNWVRQAVDTPSNTLTPEAFARSIEALFENTGVMVEILNHEKIRQENLQGLLQVGKGSENLPCLVKLHYRPLNSKTSLTLVGKGITFDSGGLSLKPSESMLDMKGDMAGAATVAGIFKAALDLNLPIELYGLLPLAENMISGHSYKVSDVITYRNGKTVEINNTDAEGRLILADALILASEMQPDLIIDLATLTGACMVALGTDMYGVFAKNPSQGREYVRFVNEETSEFAWDLPLFSKYQENLKSKLADLKNTGKRWGGAISAALFLKEFVAESKDWMHLDIAGPFFDDGLGLFDGQATGIPLESLYLYLENLT